MKESTKRAQKKYLGKLNQIHLYLNDSEYQAFIVLFSMIKGTKKNAILNAVRAFIYR